MLEILHRLKVPIRQMLDRNEDMRTTGVRHPYLGRYKVAIPYTVKIKFDMANLSHFDKMTIIGLSLS